MASGIPMLVSLRNLPRLAKLIMLLSATACILLRISTQHPRLLGFASPLRGADEPQGLVVRNGTAREIQSRRHPKKTYFEIVFANMTTYNPNAIPHPTMADTYVIMAMRNTYGDAAAQSGQYVCLATFIATQLVCTAEPRLLLFNGLAEPNCPGNLSRFRGHGARDGRFFYGVDGIYIMYGAPSVHTCLGLWLLDARQLIDAIVWSSKTPDEIPLPHGTEITRPVFVNKVQKNFFAFWDAAGDLYAHFDVFPARSFARIHANGSSQQDLGEQTSERAKICMDRYMPRLTTTDRGYEDIHQATNSLSITMCNRNDRTCVPNGLNTFIIHIFHLKTCYGFHSLYEPYVLLFSQQAPFSIHAISTLPLWIHGRTKLTLQTGNVGTRPILRRCHKITLKCFTLRASAGKIQRKHTTDILMMLFCCPLESRTVDLQALIYWREISSWTWAIVEAGGAPLRTCR